MPTISFEPDGKQIAAREGETILAASLRAGISHAHACGGKARCSTCRVSVKVGVEGCAPRRKHERFLACQTEGISVIHCSRYINDWIAKERFRDQ